MALPNNFTFDYFNFGSAKRHGRMRTPVKLYIQSGKKTGGMLIVSELWLKHQHLGRVDQLAMQVKGKEDTYLIFNPPLDSPRIQRREKSYMKETVVFANTLVVRNLLEIFAPTEDSNLHEMWLDRVGIIGESMVYRLRNLSEQDKLYTF